MQELRIDKTEDTPQVHLNNNGELSISGRSLPEDAFSYYEPVLKWLSDYATSPAAITTIKFDLEYFNTASAKQIFKTVNLLANIAKQKKVTVKWHYDKGDKDMRSSGERFSKLCNMPFELVEN
jgi:hypothetical protein